MPRLVIVSDTHEQHWKINVPNGDILIHCGDYSGRGSIPATVDFNRWLATLPHSHKICIAGNHDWIFQKQNSLARSILTAATYLEDSETTVMGLRIYGSPWQPEFFDWAFNLPRGPKIQAKWDLIPSKLDVLITHSPPAGILDAVRPGTARPDHVGCQDLLEAVQDKKPRIHCFGHIHESAGEHKTKDTHFINASILNDAYKIKGSPIIVDI